MSRAGPTVVCAVSNQDFTMKRMKSMKVWRVLQDSLLKAVVTKARTEGIAEISRKSAGISRQRLTRSLRIFFKRSLQRGLEGVRASRGRIEFGFQLASG
jgi:hypothetical protein